MSVSFSIGRERIYRCPECRRRFRSFDSLKHHLQEHRGPRQCRNCGKQLREHEYHRC
jgi:hypothetical protein